MLLGGAFGWNPIEQDDRDARWAATLAVERDRGWPLGSRHVRWPGTSGGGRDADWATLVGRQESDRAGWQGRPHVRGCRKPAWAAALAVELGRPRGKIH